MKLCNKLVRHTFSYNINVEKLKRGSSKKLVRVSEIYGFYG